MNSRYAASELGTAELPFDVEFVVEDSELILEETVKGGYTMWVEGTFRANCTSGFTANRNGNLGIVTANHCHPVDYGVGTSNITGNPGTQANAAPGGAIDLRFYPTNSPHSTTRMFQWTTGSQTGVLSVANPTAGISICHYGIESERRCGTVGNATDYCDAGLCGLYRTTTYISAGGDSGGPWYTPNSARGIHTGCRLVLGVCENSVFTGIGRVNNNLGALVLQD